MFKRKCNKQGRNNISIEHQLKILQKEKHKKDKQTKQSKRDTFKNKKIRFKQKGAQLQAKSCALYQQYQEKISCSIRLEIMMMILIGVLFAGGGGLVCSQLARGMGVGKRQMITYDEQYNRLQQELVNSIRKLSSLDYLEIKMNIDEGWLRQIVEEDNGVESLESYLRSMIFVNNSSQGDEDAVYNQLFGSVEAQKNVTRPLYNQLIALYQTEKWSVSEIEKIIGERLSDEQLAKSEELFKEKYIQEALEELNDGFFFTDEMTVYLLDASGNNLYASGIVKQIDIAETIKSTSGNLRGEGMAEFEAIYPLVVDETVHYLYAEAILSGKTKVYYTNMSDIIGMIVGIAIFIIIIIKGTAKKIRYIEYLSECLHEISKGNLNYYIEIEGKDQLAQVAKDIHYMEHQIKQQIDERIQAEKTKNDLITNVAHDLRTPLTSIIGYIGLVKDKKYETEEDVTKYLEIAYGKAEKLKVLMEDLFEYTKLSNRVVELKCDKISITTLINQLIEELSPLAEEKQIVMKSYIKIEDTSICVDIMKMTRVFENMIENAIKYSEEGRTIQIIIQGRGEDIYTTVRNKVVDMPEKDMTKLFDRFYRTDASRNSKTGGSGLGLAIAKSIVEMHNGTIWAQMDGDILGISVKLKGM